MFAADMEEIKNKRIVIEDFDADIVEQFLRFIHTDKLDEASDVSVRELLLIADNYDVCGLETLAQNLLANTLCIATVCGTLEFALLVADAKDLQTACCDFIKDNHNVVGAHGNWEALDENAKTRMLRSLL